MNPVNIQVYELSGKIGSPETVTYIFLHMFFLVLYYKITCWSLIRYDAMIVGHPFVNVDYHYLS